MRDAHLQQIVADRYAELFLEDAAQIKLADVKAGGQIVEDDGLGIMGIQILFDLQQILAFGTGTP